MLNSLERALYVTAPQHHANASFFKHRVHSTRTQGRHKADTRRTHGGHKADTWRTKYGDVAGRGQSGSKDAAGKSILKKMVLQCFADNACVNLSLSVWWFEGGWSISRPALLLLKENPTANCLEKRRQSTILPIQDVSWLRVPQICSHQLFEDKLFHSGKSVVYKVGHRAGGAQGFPTRNKKTYCGQPRPPQMTIITGNTRPSDKSSTSLHKPDALSSRATGVQFFRETFDEITPA